MELYVLSQRTLKRKVPNRVFVVFYPKYTNENIVSKSEYKKNKKYLLSVINSVFPQSKELESKSEDELIFSFAYNPRWEYANKRSFMIRMQAIFLLTKDFCPHFTTYEFREK